MNDPAQISISSANGKMSERIERQSIKIFRMFAPEIFQNDDKQVRYGSRRPV